MSRTTLSTLAGACALACACLACGFDNGASVAEGGGPADAGPADAGPGPDAPPADAAPPGWQVAHLPSSQWYAGDANAVVSGGGEAHINTTTLEVEGDITAGLTLQATTQNFGGPNVAVLRVNSLTLEAGSTLYLDGERPFIVIAEETVVIEGQIVASALRGRPGPGGAQPTQGIGAGQQGEHKGYRDSGGGGGGYGSAGAPGGAVSGGPGQIVQGGVGGDEYLDAPISILYGGSGGGQDGLPCSYSAGAGGGAVQLFAALSITIAENGAINAGGGGGGPGKECPAGNDTSLGGGAGGGSGGAIYLQSPEVSVSGWLAANGGGGGGGAGEDGEGGFGQNGRITGKALGGEAGGAGSSAGGDSGFGADLPQAGQEETTGGNAGGGGGGAGRIAILSKPDGLLTLDLERTSPEAVALEY